MLLLKSDLKDYALNLPTDFSELKQEWFDDMTTDIVVAPNYVLVALCYQDRLFSIINGITKDNMTTGVVPIAVKFGIGSETFIKPMDIIITNHSAVERANHYYTPKNPISIAKVYNYIKDDAKLYNTILKGDGSVKELKNARPIMIEFKIMPLNDIYGAAVLNPILDTVSPFIVKDNLLS